MPEASDRDNYLRRCRRTVNNDDAFRHRTMVASHTVVPLGTAKWLVWDCPFNIISLPLGRRHGQLLSLAYQQGILCDVALTSHFAVPIGTAVWLATLVCCLSASSLYTAQLHSLLANRPCLLLPASFLLTITIRCLWHPLLLGIANARLIAIELRTRNNGNL